MPVLTEIYYWGKNENEDGTVFLPRQCSPRYLTMPARIISMSGTATGLYFLSDAGDLYASGNMNTPVFPHLASLKIVQISSGLHHSVLLTASGQVYAWGKGEYGVLGLGDTRDIIIPEKVPISKAAQISCGLRHTVCLTSSGVYTWGCEYSNISSDHQEKKYSKIPNFSTRLSPHKLPIENITTISCGDQHTLLLNSQSDIYSFGSNSCGQLGLGHKKSTNIPTKLELEKNFKYISAGSHSAAISSSNELYIWGTGIFGEWIYPKLIENTGKISSIFLSSGVGFAIDENQEVYSWGNNTHGELGLGDYEQRTNIATLNLLRNRGIKHIFSCNSSVYAIGKYIEPRKKYRKSQQMMGKENIPIEKKKNSLSKEFEQLKSVLNSKENHIKALESKQTSADLDKILKENENLKDQVEEMKKIKQQWVYSIASESEKRKIAENFVKEMHDEHRMLIGTIEELEKTMAGLSRQCEVYQEKAEKHDLLLDKFRKLSKENEQLRISENISKRYKSDYSCESITMASPDISVVLDKKYRRDLSPEYVLRASKSSGELLKMFEVPEPIRSFSPYTVDEFKQTQNEPQTPPTFRDRGINSSGAIKNSLNEIRARLNLLQENKSELEGKMNDFEKKLKEQV